MGVLEAREADPDQAHRPRLQVRLLQRRARGPEDHVGVVGRARPAHLAAHQAEVRKLHLDVDGLCLDAGLAKPLRQPYGQVLDRVLDPLPVGDVLLEGHLGADRLERLGAVHRRAILALGKLLKDGRAAAQGLDQALGVVLGEVADPAHAHHPEPVLGLRSDARQHPDRHRGHEGGLGVGWDDDQAIGFAGGGGDLGDHLAHRDPDACGQPDVVADHELDLARDVLRGRRPVPGTSRDVDIGLVERDPLDLLRRGEAAEDRVDGAARLPVLARRRLDHDQVRAEGERLMERHRGVDAEGPCLVRGAHDDRAPGRPRDRDRPAAE